MTPELVKAFLPYAWIILIGFIVWRISKED